MECQDFGDCPLCGCTIELNASRMATEMDIPKLKGYQGRAVRIIQLLCPVEPDVEATGCGWTWTGYILDDRIWQTAEGSD